MKILTVIGARPQFIKAGMVSLNFDLLNNRGRHIQEVIVHTGQHFDSNMSSIFFKELGLKEPKYNLGVRDRTNISMIARMMDKLESVVYEEKPDLILVYGDTNSTVAGALVGSMVGIPVAHVEAGLRSYDFGMQEEINRVITDRISQWLFCPTDIAVKNLVAEGFLDMGCRVIKSGDVMYDAVLHYEKFAKKPNIHIESDFILFTLHRAENVDREGRLRNILDALEEIGEEVDVVWPVHPRTKRRLLEFSIEVKNLYLIEPTSYLETLWLIKNSELVITDSGGLQKEAFFMRKHSIVLRDRTEWLELINHRFSTLAGGDQDRILYAYRNFKFNNDFDLPLFGDGDAALQIAMHLADMCF